MDKEGSMSIGWYTAKRQDDGRILVRMPRVNCYIEADEARKLRDALTAALLSPPALRDQCPIWLLELGYMAHAKAPLFGGLLVEEDGVPRWTKDNELSDWLAKKWVAIVEGGFVITERGRHFYKEEWAKYQAAK